MNTIDAKIESHVIEQISIQGKNLKQTSLIKKLKPRKKRKWKDWKDLSYGEKSFRMSLWVLLAVLLTPLAGISSIAIIPCAIISIRLGLRSLKEKEEGLSRTKRNQGIIISLITLVLVTALIGLLIVISNALF